MGEVQIENQRGHKYIGNKQLGAMLIDKNLITPQVLETALELQKTQRKRLGEILVENGFVTAEELVETMSTQLNLPFVDLKSHTVQVKH